MNLADQKQLIHASSDQFCDLPSGVRLCYRSYGEHGAPVIVLIVGLGLQLTYWPADMLAKLVGAGFRVITLDNRDIGRSSRYKARPPSLMDIIFNRAREDAYCLKDMASDVVGLLDHLNIQQAHVAGMSMGGMIAQTVSALFPHRVHTLTSIFSNTGARKKGQPSLAGKLKLIKPRPKTREEAITRYVQTAQFIAGSRYKAPDEQIMAYAEQAWDRGDGAKAAAGVARQLGAIIKSGNRERLLRGIAAPALVIHGDRDPLVHPSGGQATASAIPNSTFLIIPGMGHYIDDAVGIVIANLMRAHISQHIEQSA